MKMPPSSGSALPESKYIWRGRGAGKGISSKCVFPRPRQDGRERPGPDAGLGGAGDGCWPTPGGPAPGRVSAAAGSAVPPGSAALVAGKSPERRRSGSRCRTPGMGTGGTAGWQRPGPAAAGGRAGDGDSDGGGGGRSGSRTDGPSGERSTRRRWRRQRRSRTRRRSG